MATARSSRGHTVVAVLVGVTALVHLAFAVIPSARPMWAAGVSVLLTIVAVVLLVAGLRSPRARFGGAGEDAWLVACAAAGALGVASALALAFVSISSRTGLDPWSVAPLLLDALTVRVAVFTLRRVPTRT